MRALSEQQRPRTLTEALRAMPAEELAQLLALRPDLLDPVPEDVADLASRSTTSASISRAVEELNTWLRTVAEALSALPDPASAGDMATMLGESRVTVAAAVAELRQRGLLWGADDQLHLVRPVREAFEPYPGGLAPPSAHPMSVEQIDAAVDACGTEARTVLERLRWSPTGAVRYADRPVSIASARSPIERLLSHQLLRPLDSETVILPREVSWRLRAGRFTAEPVATEPPRLIGQLRDADFVDRAAAGAAFAVLHDIELLAHQLETVPHKLLRGGGLATRDVSALARHFDAGSDYASFLIECAAAAQLVAPGSAGSLLPTPEYDQWLGRAATSRWQVIVGAWLGADRFFARSSAAGGHTLGHEAYARGAVSLRTTVLRIVEAVEPGTVLDLGQLADAAGWHRPRLTHAPLTAEQLVEWTWREGSWLGLAALGAVSSFAKLLLQPGQQMPDELKELFPTPVRNFVIQNDLTAVAPGPLEHTVAAELRMLADQESRGGAGVYRFTATSLRGAFNQGWSAADVRRWLERHSTTGVPQPLAYLVDDVARRHDSIRVGPAGSYVRLSDQAQAAALLANPAAAALGLRAVAPGVLVASVDEHELLPLLQELGDAPAIENGAGEVIGTPPARRATGHVARQQDIPSATEVADALLAHERRPHFHAESAAGPTKQAVGRSSVPRTLARSIE